jgi:SAM-dependent methyltransferase
MMIRRAAILVTIVAALVMLTGRGISLHAQSQGRGDTPAPQRHATLYSPLDLGLLEAPDRAAWQKPDQIMDALHVAEGAKVADIGAGAGWFTIRLARRVGPNGVVFAQDVQPLMLEAIRRRVNREGLQNVQTRLGSGGDPNMSPKSLDAALVVDSYPEVEVGDRVALLRNLARALKPQGLIGIVNWKPGQGGPGPDEEGRVAREAVEADARAAHLQVRAHENLPYQYLLVLAP